LLEAETKVADRAAALIAQRQRWDGLIAKSLSR
jgi:hypothetical protein